LMWWRGSVRCARRVRASTPVSNRLRVDLDGRDRDWRAPWLFCSQLMRRVRRAALATARDLDPRRMCTGRCRPAGLSHGIPSTAGAPPRPPLPTVPRSFRRCVGVRHRSSELKLNAARCPESSIDRRTACTANSLFSRICRRLRPAARAQRGPWRDGFREASSPPGKQPRACYGWPR
jgi:hypothetical protein